MTDPTALFSQRAVHLAAIASIDRRLARQGILPLDAPPPAPGAHCGPTESVFAAVARETGISYGALLGRGGERHVAWARHAAVLVLVDVRGMSASAIGRAMGRDHTTAAWSVRKGRELMERDARFRGLVESVKRAINDARGAREVG